MCRYVRQGLGKLLCSPPHDDHACAIQLNFTPKGGPKTKATGDNDDGDDHNDGSDDVYQRAHRPNCCVGCGAGSIVMADNLKPPRMRVGNGGRLNGSTGLADPVNNGSSNSSISSSYSSNSSTSTSGSNSSGSNSSNSNSNSNDDVAINSFGGSDGLNRFSIVPQCFRRLLPVAVKSRSSHDIVLLCHPCRDKAQVSDYHIAFYSSAARFFNHPCAVNDHLSCYPHALPLQLFDTLLHLFAHVVFA